MACVMTQFMEATAQSASIFEDLTTLRIFVRTVQVGNFSEVARRMDVTPAMVSKRMAAFEAKAGQRLFNRDTRHLMVTEVGQMLYERAMRALLELDLAAEEMSSIQDTATGHLRLTAPAMLGQAVIAQQLPRFLRDNPLLSVDINFSMEKLDLYKGRIDVAVRIADVIDPGMIAIKLAPYSRAFCASPDYLRQYGVPLVPEDLMNHNCLITRGSSLNTRWPVKREDEIGHVHVKGNFTTDNGQAGLLVCRAGLGVMMCPRWMAEDDLKRGTLVEILADYLPDNRAVYAVLLQRTGTSAKLQTAVDFLKNCFAGMR